MPNSQPQQPCPECRAVKPHHPFGDELILRCQACGFAIGADDMHNVVENWDRRARERTEATTGPSEVRWKPGMTDAERIELIGCAPKTFARLSTLPRES